MIRIPPRTTRPDTFVPYTALCRSRGAGELRVGDAGQRAAARRAGCLFDPHACSRAAATLRLGAWVHGWWPLVPPTCLVSEVGGTGARVVAIGAPNLDGVGGWGHGCTWCGQDRKSTRLNYSN